MSHTISGSIRRAPHIAAGSNSNGSYTMFCFELSEYNKGFGDAEDNYSNYSIALFAKTDAAVNFHNQAIEEGSYVVVSCDKLSIDKQVGNDGTEYIKLKMMNARLDGFNNPNQQQGAPANQPMQQPAQGYGQPQQGGFAPQQQAQQPMQQGYSQQQGGQQPQQNGFSNQDIPFA